MRMTVLKDDFQSKLNLTPGRARVAQLAELRIGVVASRSGSAPHARHPRTVRRRQQERRRVGQVEELSAELDAEPLRHHRLLEQGKVEVHRSGSTSDAARGVAEQLDIRP